MFYEISKAINFSMLTAVWSQEQACEYASEVVGRVLSYFLSLQRTVGSQSPSFNPWSKQALMLGF